MNHLSEKINQRIKVLESIIKEKRIEVANAPYGCINFARSGNRLQYYYKNDSKDEKRKYLKKADEPIVKALCQKDYDKRVLERAEKEYCRLKMLQKIYQVGVFEDVYEKLNADRKSFVTPIVLSEEEFISQWLRQDYPRKGFAPNAPEYYSDNGERVRSKSEILIANALKKHGVPYRYEAPLYLNGLGIIHPDFTVLNVTERKEYYWEHMGKMDDPQYIEQALQRIDAYEKNNIFPGVKLILSHETLMHPIDSRNIEKMIVQYLK